MNLKPDYEVLKKAAELKRSRKRKTNTSPPIFSMSRKPEIDFTRSLLAIAKECKTDGRQVLEIFKERQVHIGDSMTANVGDAPAWLSRIGEVIKYGAINKVAAIAGKIAGKVVRDQVDEVKDLLTKQVNFSTGIDIKDVIRYQDLTRQLEETIAVNVGFINSIPAEYHSKLEKLVLTAAQDGKGTVWLGEQISKLDKVTATRAKTIAQSQVIKISSEYTEETQKGLGIDEYVWISREDKRVRGHPKCVHPQYRGDNAKYSHYKRHDHIFSWVKTPGAGDPGVRGGGRESTDGRNFADDGHPGKPPMCRCKAFPYIR